MLVILIATLYSSEYTQKRIPEEKGPFGKSNRRRGFSRSRTAPPSRKEDLVEAENLKDIDDIFTKYNAELRARNQAAGTGSGTNGNSKNSGSNAEKGALQSAVASEPAEVVLYGYGADVQYAAIEFFERVSGGHIYEDYDRYPPSSRYSLSLSRSQASFTTPFSNSISGISSSTPTMASASTRSNGAYFGRNNKSSSDNAVLSESALRKKNTYVGGNHWIKVTFNSARAADAACRSAPHIICGYLVHAQPYRGAGPDLDMAIMAPANVNQMNASASPGRSSDDATTTLSQQTLQPDISPGSSTATSATVTDGRQTLLRRHNTSSTPSSNTVIGTSAVSYPSLNTMGRSSSSLSAPPYDSFANSKDRGKITTSNSQPAPRTPTQARSKNQTQLTSPLRIQGAKRAVLRPADEALLPVVPRWQRVLSRIPIASLFLEHSQHYDALKPYNIHGKEMIIGTQVPRRESDGAFDWENASFYWRCWAYVDLLFGTDFCGISGGE